MVQSFSVQACPQLLVIRRVQVACLPRGQWMGNHGVMMLPGRLLAVCKGLRTCGTKVRALCIFVVMLLQQLTVQDDPRFGRTSPSYNLHAVPCVAAFSSVHGIACSLRHGSRRRRAPGPRRDTLLCDCAVLGCPAAISFRIVFSQGLMWVLQKPSRACVCVVVYTVGTTLIPGLLRSGRYDAPRGLRDLACLRSASCGVMAFHVSAQMLLYGAVFAEDRAWLFAPVFRRVSSAEPRLAAMLLSFTVATALRAEVKHGRSVRRALRQHRKSEASTSALVRLQGCRWQQKRRRPFWRFSRIALRVCRSAAGPRVFLDP